MEAGGYIPLRSGFPCCVKSERAMALRLLQGSRKGTWVHPLRT